MPGLTGERVVMFLQEYSGQLLGFMGGIAGPAFGMVLIPVLTFFLLFYRLHLQEFTVRLLRRSPMQLVKRRTEELREVAQKYLVGVMIVAGILAVDENDWRLSIETHDDVKLAVKKSTDELDSAEVNAINGHSDRNGGASNQHKPFTV